LIARVPFRIPAAATPWLGLALALVLAGVASIALRQDSSWDLQNYHLYNAWAFIHDRFGLDWAPAQLQSFYSPFLDLPFYALVAADLPPRAIAFALAIPTGVAWYFFARLAAHLFAGLPAQARTPAIAAAMTLGVTAPMSVSLIGLTTNDWYSAAFVMSGTMAFAYFLVHAPQSFFPVLNGGDAAILYCFVFLYIVFAGPGPISLDRAIGRD